MGGPRRPAFGAEGFREHAGIPPLPLRTCKALGREDHFVPALGLSFGQIFAGRVCGLLHLLRWEPRPEGVTFRWKWPSCRFVLLQI
jgi:hypothetical protein